LPPSDRSFLAAAAFVVGTALAHMLLGGFPQPLPWYFPETRTWEVHRQTDAVAMVWYANAALSLLGGAALAAAVWAYGRFVAKGPVQDAFTLHAWGWNAVLLTVLSMALYLFTYRPW